MAVKLIVSWDVNTGSESEYSEFIVNEFIPRIQRLGLSDIQFWYTTFGKCEQILASGMTEQPEQMDHIRGSEEWQLLKHRLLELVSDYDEKVVLGTKGFQL